MPCYTIVHLTVTNPEGFAKYQAKVPATIDAHGGRYLVRGGDCEDIEGSLPHDRHVVLEFADRASFDRWYNSPEYQAILPIRLANSEGTATVVEGYAP